MHAHSSTITLTHLSQWANDERWREGKRMLRKIASVVYGAGAYLLFLGAFLYLIAFGTNVARHSVSGAPSLPAFLAALVDIALITLFGLQHGIMARPEFKRRWTRLMPPHLERSTFVWFAAVLVIVIVQFWQPIEGDLWNVSGAAMIALYTICLLGFLTVPAVSFLTDHFELFGLRQVFEYALERPRSKPEFKERALYKKLRHPMMLGLLIAFWATPHMTAGHLLFAALMTSYILVGVYFEERDLARAHGQVYREYQARVPRLLPFRGPASAQAGPLKARAEAAQKHS
jgi:protein-S-isoprenylcysteine O-methyltransferase Ste14